MDWNDLDSTGVSEEVIDAIREWSVWLDDDEDDDYYMLTFGMPVNRRDAQYAVQSLLALLPQDGIGHAKTTTLSLGGDEISDEAIDIFCGFVRETSLLPGLLLGSLPQQQFRRLLNALHTNTSVKELKIYNFGNHESALSISELLQHRTDFTSLGFVLISFPITLLLPGLRHGHLCLQKLSFEYCAIDDEKARLIVEALVECNFSVLQELNLYHNSITSIGLRSLSQLTAAVLPGLQQLNLSLNPELLNDPVNIQFFIRNMLLSENAILKELNVSRCGEHYGPIIAALEDNHQLHELYISHSNHQNQAICDQLAQSLPKMKGLKSLVCNPDLFHPGNRPLWVALKKNTSIVELSVDVAILHHAHPIQVRNRRLAQVDGLLRPSSTASAVGGSGNNVVVPNSLWSFALAAVGQGRSQVGATPVFKVLCDQLATWVEMKPSDNEGNNGKKRKRRDGD